MWKDEYTIYRTLCWPEDLAINGIYINVKAGSYTNTHSKAILFRLLGELKSLLSYFYSCQKDLYYC
jgi:hypothetical protein